MKEIMCISTRYSQLKAFLKLATHAVPQWRFLFVVLSLGAFSLSGFAQLANDLITIVDGSDKYYYRVRSNVSEVNFLGSTKTGVVTIPERIRDQKGFVYTVRGVYRDTKYPISRETTALNLPASIIFLNGIGNNKIQHFTVPAGTRNITPQFFNYFDKLESITVAGGNTSFYAKDGVLFKKVVEAEVTKNGLYTYPRMKTVGSGGKYSLPADVTVLHTNAFLGNTTLKHLFLHKNVSDIITFGIGFLKNCTNVQKIEIEKGNARYEAPNNVIYEKKNTGKKKLVTYPASLNDGSYTIDPLCDEIGEYGIYHANLTSLDLSSVTTLNKEAIAFCEALTTLTIPTTLPDIPRQAIIGCTGLTKYIVPIKHETLKSDPDGVIYSKNGEILKYYPLGRKGAYTILEGTKTVQAQAFRDAIYITKVTFPSSLETIEHNAFQYCKVMTSIDFGASNLKTIGNQAFNVCESLGDITLPASVETIGSAAFNRNHKLHNFIVPANSKLKTLGSDLFSGGGIKKFKFLGSSALTEIPANFLFNVTTLEEFVLPINLTKIGQNAFKGCTKLSTISFDPNSQITTIEAGAFADCNIKSLVFHDKLQTIGEGAFRGSKNLTEVTIKPAIKHIDPRAFEGCSKLQRFILEGDNKKYTVHQEMLFSKDKSELVIFPQGKISLTEPVTLPASTLKIGDFAFFGAEGLTKVIIPKSVTKVGRRSFALCPELTEITLLSDKKLDKSTFSINTATDLNLNSFDADQKRKITVYVPKSVHAQYIAPSETYYAEFKAVKALDDFSVSYQANGRTLGTCYYRSNGENTATLLNVNLNPALKTFILKSQATKAQEGAQPAKTYTVTQIDEKAFLGATNLKEVIIDNNNLTSIGVRAFQTSDTEAPSIQRIIFVSSNVPLTLESEGLGSIQASNNEFDPTQNIYVRQKEEDKFKKQWKKYASKISYKIPGAPIKNKYITFSREFDVDLDLADGSGTQNVHAFVGGKGKLQSGSGDYGTKTLQKVSFSSINVAGEGSYIPANTGVLIKNMSNETTKNFFYRIGEKTVTKTVTNNLLKPAVHTDKELTANQSNYYVLHQSIFRFVNKNVAGTAKVNVPVHKAYLDLGATSGAATLSLYFDGDDDLTTAIEELEMKNTTAPYYHLNGTRAVSPRKGLYIQQGKKVFIH